MGERGGAGRSGRAGIGAEMTGGVPLYELLLDRVDAEDDEPASPNLRRIPPKPNDAVEAEPERDSDGVSVSLCRESVRKARSGG